ncbi:MAG TPA: polysaccharide pyruvyl transferase family protein [Gemmatimonadaceae bacterium]|nr:polysaccharide pyruvyl transferase family protein [Gemmatimonadaceae bacterium]
MQTQRTLNVVFSATRQWNPGDEFIAFGCMNALRAAGLEFNPIVFNRNPQTRRTRMWWLSKLDSAVFGGKLAPFLDNSFKDDTDPAIVDLVVFAGSPEWHGRRLAPLYELIAARKIPTIFLGIGSANDFTLDATYFTETEMQVLRDARLIACREERTALALKPVNARHITCPALLSCTSETQRRDVKRVGLIFGSDRAVKHNRVSADTFAYMTSLYRRLREQIGREVEFELVAHYIDELSHARLTFADMGLRYSFDAADYREIYSRYDIVIGHRVHGIGIAASQGIPGICIAHDKRGGTALGFKAEMVTVGQPVDDVVALFKKMRAEIAQRSEKIIAHKRAVAGQYQDALVPVLRGLTP